MSESRKLAAILVADVVGYSRLAGADEDRILARLRALRSDLIDPTIALHRGRVVKRLDPKNVPAMTGLASVLQWRAYDGWTDDWDRDFGRAEGLIKRALLLQPENSILRVANAQDLAWKSQWRAAVAEAETAISYDRNNALAYANGGTWKQYLGRSDAADAPISDALIDLAAANAWAGHDRQANDAVAKLRKARPGITLQGIWPEDQTTDDPTFKVQWARIVEGLRKAGLPDEPTSAPGRLARAKSLDDARAWDLALKEVEAVIAEHPDNAKAYGAASLYKMFLGRSEEGIADVEKALRLSPNDNEASTWLANLCYLHGKLAQWEQTIEWCEKAMAAGTPQKSRALANLTAAYAWTGRDKEASETIERLRNVDPHFTALTYQTIIDNRPNPTYQAQTARVLEGMRKARLPEE